MSLTAYYPNRGSATRVILVGTLLLAVICALSVLLLFFVVNGKPIPDRQVTPMDFFPPTSGLPADYVVLEEPRWAGAYSPLAIGDVNDAYATYAPAGKSYGLTQLIVYHQLYTNTIDDEYDYLLIFQEDRQKPRQVAFQSERAQRSTIGCSRDSRIDDNGDIWWVCHYLARYDEFTVDLMAAVGPEHLSWNEFETLIRAIDAQASKIPVNAHIPPVSR